MYDLKQPIDKRPNNTSRISQFVVDNFDRWQMAAPVKSHIRSPYNLPVIGAVGGGKGGVGKSIVSANYASMLAQFGFRVLVVDLDLGCSNLHSHFGVAMPKKTIADYLVRKRLDFRDVILPAPIQGVAFIAGGREEQLLEEFESTPAAMAKLWQNIYECKKNFNVDIVLLDLGAGTHKHTLDFFVGSHLGLLTVLPEPTSIENAYVFLKMAIMKMVLNVGKNCQQDETAQDVIAALSSMNSSSLNQGYGHLLQNMKASFPRFIHNYFQAVNGRHLGILINQTREDSDLEIGPSMEQICTKYFGLQSKYLGYLNHDEAVLKSLRNRNLLIADYPHSIIAKRLSIAAGNSLDLLGMQRRT